MNCKTTVPMLWGYDHAEIISWFLAWVLSHEHLDEEWPAKAKSKARRFLKTNSVERYLSRRRNYPPPLSCLPQLSLGPHENNTSSESTALSIKDQLCSIRGTTHVSFVAIKTWALQGLITALNCWCGWGSLSIRSGILTLWFVQYTWIFLKFIYSAIKIHL